VMRQWMATRERKRVPFRYKRPFEKSVGAAPYQRKCNIQATACKLPDQLPLSAINQFDRHRSVGRLARANSICDPIPRNAEQYANSKDLRDGRRRHLLKRYVEVSLDPTRVNQKPRPCFGQLDASVRSKEERCPHLSLKLCDTDRQGWLRDIAVGGRARKIPLIRNGQEIAQKVTIYHRRYLYTWSG
jgi:hypothetical protein